MTHASRMCTCAALSTVSRLGEALEVAQKCGVVTWYITPVTRICKNQVVSGSGLSLQDSCNHSRNHDTSARGIQSHPIMIHPITLQSKQSTIQSFSIKSRVGPDFAPLHGRRPCLFTPRYPGHLHLEQGPGDSDGSSPWMQQPVRNGPPAGRSGQRAELAVAELTRLAMNSPSGSAVPISHDVLPSFGDQELRLVRQRQSEPWPRRSPLAGSRLWAAPAGTGETGMA
jgi:hypothetical protein